MLDPAPIPCTRRDVLRMAAVGAGAALGLDAGAAPGSDSGAARGLRRPLGASGLLVPMLGVGTATAGRELDRPAAVALFHGALDAGVGLFDTAPAAMGYGHAAAALAAVLRERRGEAFVVTKVFTDDGARALRLLRENLRELGIDRADLVLIHSVGDARIDPVGLLGPRGALAALRRARADGLTRAIGLSAHDRPGKVRDLVRAAGELDAVMVPVNAADRFAYGFEATVGPEATSRGAGLIGFKVLAGLPSPSGPGSTPRPGCPAILTDPVAAALRYAWAQPELAAATVGLRSRADLDRAVALARDFAPLTAPERAAWLAEGRALAAARGTPYGPRA